MNIFIVFVCFAIAKGYGVEQLNEFIVDGSKSATVVNNNNYGDRILSRKRRYLVFPEGSSFQVGPYRIAL